MNAHSAILCTLHSDIQVVHVTRAYRYTACASPTRLPSVCIVNLYGEFAAAGLPVAHVTEELLPSTSTTCPLVCMHSLNRLLFEYKQPGLEYLYPAGRVAGGIVPVGGGVGAGAGAGGGVVPPLVRGKTLLWNCPRTLPAGE